MSESFRKEVPNVKPTLYLPRLDFRSVGQPSRLYFVSHSGRDYYTGAKKLNESKIKNNKSFRNINNLKNTTESKDTQNLSMCKGNYKYISNQNNSPFYTGSQKKSKHLKVLFESESSKIIMQNNLKSNSTKHVINSDSNKQLKIFYDCSYSPINTDQNKITITEPNIGNSSSFNSSKFINTNSCLYKEPLWAAFNKLQESFESITNERDNSIFSKNVKKDLSSNFPKNRNKIGNVCSNQFDYEKELERLNRKFDIPVGGRANINFKSLDKKLGNISERLKRVKLSNLVKGKIVYTGN